jgi:hypothetical protein
VRASIAAGATPSPSHRSHHLQIVGIALKLRSTIGQSLQLDRLGALAVGADELEGVSQTPSSEASPRPGGALVITCQRQPVLC